MARHGKMGLDYFPMDVGMVRERRIIAMTNRFGGEGVYVYLTILCRIYEEEGYFMRWDDLSADMMAYQTHQSLERIEQLIAFCIDMELFDREKFSERAVLTSEDIQRRYLSAVRKRAKQRKRYIVKSEYWLLDEQETKENFVDLDSAPFQRGNEENQRLESHKEKERKEKERKEKESKGESAGRSAAPPAKPAEEDALSLFEDGFTMKKEEYDALCADYGKSAVDGKWAHAIEWEAAQGKRFPVHMMRLKLRSWLEEDRQKAKSGALSSGGSSGYFNKREGLPANYTGSRSGYFSNQRTYTDEELDALFATNLDELDV